MSETRSMTSQEKGLLDILLSAEFQGKHEVKCQLEDALVETLDENGSLRFTVTCLILANVFRRVPIEAQALDSDGAWIHLLLHVVNGKVAELEIYKDDSTPVTSDLMSVEWELAIYE